ncbi:MAG: Brp/Blh family beta-carotene 15,15'-dioxygenase [Bacteroidota bacterium]
MSARPPMAWPRLGLMVAWGSVGLSLVAAPWIAAAPTAWLLVPWALSVLVLGLPHGALDPFVPFRMSRTALTAVRLGVFCVAYLGLGVVVVALWMLAPVAAAVGFIALTLAHWGQGDVFFLRAMGWDRHLASGPHLVLAGAVRGALPMGVPLAAQPEAYAAVLGGLGRLFEPSTEADVVASAVSASSAAQVGLAVLFGGYVLWGAVSAARRGAWRSLALDLGEVAVLTVFFAVLPPLWSVGVYFCAWHALRHLARLEPVVSPRQPGRFALLATPFTLGALVLFALGGWLLVERPEAGDLLAIYLVGIASVTVPHVLVVAWMDVRQAVWRV